MNKFLAKHLSKGVSGFGGMFLHFLIVSAVLGLLLGGGAMGISVYAQTHPESFSQIPKSEEAAVTQMLNEGRFSEVFKKYPSAAWQTVIVFSLPFVAGPVSFVWSVILTAMRSKYYKDAKKAKRPGGSGTFGTARYAMEDEVKAAGLAGAGIVFGTMGKGLIEKPPQVEGHVLVVGGTGTGKSRGVVIPTLLRWPGAALVVDVKGELSGITAERRRAQVRVYVFDPASPTGGSRYDPVAACTTIDAAQDLARTLIPTPQGNTDPFWSNCAQAILAAFLFEGATEGHYLGDIAERLCIEPITDLVAHCRNSSIREVRLLASVSYDMPENTLGGVVSEIKSHLITLASDENLNRATSGSDWTMQALEEGATVYLKVPEHLLEQYKSLWTAIIGQAFRHLAKRAERAAPPILVCLDEMPRLSAISGLTAALATLRSRNVHILGIVQSMAQLDAIYGREQRAVIADNCRYKYVLSATDPETQKYFSDLAGQQTVISRSESGNFLPTHSRSEAGAPLIRPEDWAHLAWPVLLAPKLYPARLALVWWDKIMR